MSSPTLGSDESSSENESLHARRPDQRGEPPDARHRKAITKRTGNRKSKSCRFCPHAQVAAGGNARSAAGARAGDRGDGGHTALFDRRQHAIEPAFVFHRVLRRFESAELVDVGARREGLVAGPLKDQNLDRAILAGLLADLREPLVHLEGEGIARLRAIERGTPDAVPHLKQKVTEVCGLLLHAIVIGDSALVEWPWRVRLAQ